MKNLRDASIVVSTHLYATGPATDLRDYLIHQKIKDLLFIGHPLDKNSPNQESVYQRYQRGKLSESKNLPGIVGPSFFRYLSDIYRTVKWVIRSGEKWDLMVGSDNLNAFSGLILKLLFRVEKVVYYTIDYSPIRFHEKYLNYIYHLIDRIAVTFSDETWNLSPRMKEARIRYHNLISEKQKHVPIGIWTDSYSRTNISRNNCPTLVFMGNILKKQGIQHVIEALPEIVKKINNFLFLIIGGGIYLPEIKHQVKRLGMCNHVKFTGYLADHDQVVNNLLHGWAAIALYETTHEGDISYTYFSDPGKIKEYLAAGLPVLVSDVPYNAAEIQNNQCGMIVSAKAGSISKVIIDLLSDKEKILLYRANALTYSKNFDWSKIFESNLSRFFSLS